MKLDGTLSYLLYAASIALAAPIEKRAGSAYSGGATANDVTNGVCAPLTLIFARGSTETGNMGSSVGPALAKKLIAMQGAGGVAIQGVDYPATIESNISMGSEGGPTMAQLAQKALQACPNTKIALSGYSQGGSVIHYAVKSAGLSPSSVAAVVIYGDPEDGTAVGSLPASKLKEFCAAGDGVCETHTFAISAAHLSYTSGSDIPDGASFIVQQAGISGSSAGAASSSSSAAAPASSAPATSLGGASSPSASGGLGSLTSGTSSTGSGLGAGSSGTGAAPASSAGGASSSSGLGGLTGAGSTGSGLGTSSGGTGAAPPSSTGTSGSSMGGSSTGASSMGGSSTSGSPSTSGGLGGLTGAGASGGSLSGGSSSLGGGSSGLGSSSSGMSGF